jgi:deoxycytidine triphosphate deaminase
MSLLTDIEIKEAIERGDISIENFDTEKCLQPASYDMRVGKRAILSRSVSLEEFKTKVAEQEAKEIDLEKEGSVTIPAGAFCLVTTLEKITLSRRYAGHIGIRSYYTRKGLSLLSGLQIDPGFSGVLVLGLCNLSPRSFTIEYQDPICTIEIHRLNRDVEKPYPASRFADQREGKIPLPDKDYLRTIETMSISDMTKAILMLSQNVSELGTDIKNLKFWIPVITGIIVAILLWAIK